MQLQAVGITDVGLKRDRNEDAYLINDEMKLYVVADGMGGHVGGQLASSLAVDLVESELANALISTVPQAEDPVERTRAMVVQAVERAGSRIFAHAAAHPELKGMGTTIVLLLVVGPNAFVAHVGDSRVYLLRDGDLEQITEDHSLVAQSVREGTLTEAQASTHRMRNIITRALGFHAEVEVDVQVRAVRRGDTFLLCSDGLSGKLSKGEMASALKSQSLDDAARNMVNLACSHGGEDNISLVITTMGLD